MEKTIITHQEAIIIALQAIRKLNDPKPGDFETIPRTMANNPLPDIRAAIDEKVKNRARRLNYEYIPPMSTAEAICFLDTTPISRQYTNGVEYYKPAYDYEKGSVVWVPIEPII